MENAQILFLNFLVEVPCIPVNHVKSFCSTLSKRMWRMLCLRNRSNWQCLIQFMITWPSEDVLWDIWHAIFSYTLSFNFSWPDCRLFLGACPSWQCIWCHSFSEISFNFHSLWIRILLFFHVAVTWTIYFEYFKNLEVEFLIFSSEL